VLTQYFGAGEVTWLASWAAGDRVPSSGPRIIGQAGGRQTPALALRVAPLLECGHPPEPQPTALDALLCALGAIEGMPVFITEVAGGLAKRLQLESPVYPVRWRRWADSGGDEERQRADED
jgi:hypothetical protein